MLQNPSLYLLHIFAGGSYICICIHTLGAWICYNRRAGQSNELL